MSDSTNTTAAAGISALDLLGILFIALKLLGKISWSWWAVTAPIWIPFALVFGVLGVIVAVLLGAELVAKILRR